MIRRGLKPQQHTNVQRQCTFSSKVTAAKPFASSFLIVIIMYLLSVRVCSHIVCIVARCLEKNAAVLNFFSYGAAKKEISKPSPGSVFTFCPNVSSDLIKSKLGSFFCRGCFAFTTLRCAPHCKLHKFGLFRMTLV